MDEEGEMSTRNSGCRNIGMSETKWPRIILCDSMGPCLSFGSKVNLSPWKLLESTVTSFCAWHFIFHPLICPFPLLTMRIENSKCRNMIAGKQRCPGLSAPCFQKPPWLLGCSGDNVHQNVWLRSCNSARWAESAA